MSPYPAPLFELFLDFYSRGPRCVGDIPRPENFYCLGEPPATIFAGRTPQIWALSPPPRLYESRFSSIAAATPLVSSIHSPPPPPMSFLSSSGHITVRLFPAFCPPPCSTLAFFYVKATCPRPDKAPHTPRLLPEQEPIFMSFRPTGSTIYCFFNPSLPPRPIMLSTPNFPRRCFIFFSN